MLVLLLILSIPILYTLAEEVLDWKHSISGIFNKNYTFGYEFDVDTDYASQLLNNVNDGWYLYLVNGRRTMFRVFESPMQFHEAEENCRKYDAHLASFHSLNEFNFIKTLARKAMGGFVQNLWTGLYHTGQNLSHLPNYKLYFTDGTAYDIPGELEVHKMFWVPINDHYQPDNHGLDQKEFCIEMLDFGDHTLLNDQYCDSHHKYHVCKYDPETTGYKRALPSEVVNGEKSPTTVAPPHAPTEEREFRDEYVLYEHATQVPSLPRSTFAVVEAVVTEVITEPDVPLANFLDNNNNDKNSYCRCKGLSPTIWHVYLGLAGVSFPMALAIALAMWVKLVKFSRLTHYSLDTHYSFPNEHYEMDNNGRSVPKVV